jgi:Domain of unknown function (DUF4178)
VTGQVQQISCPNCGGAIEIKAAGYSITLICQYCSSVLDLANKDVRIITAYNEAADDLTLKLGSRGELEGAELEVIGYLRRSDDEMSWEEYLLFNPYCGYRWLIFVEGEWRIGSMLTSLPMIDDYNIAVHDGQRFEMEYDATEAVTDYVLGEFYWRVKVGDRVQASEFVNNHIRLSLEEDASERNWTETRPISAHSVERAFGLTDNARSYLDDYGVEDSNIGDGLIDFYKMMIMAIGTFLIFFIASVALSGNGPSINQSFTLTSGAEAQTFKIGEITIERPYQAISIEAFSPGLTNKWIDLDYSLIDKATQKSVDVYEGIEFYEGYDSDGRWTEGSQSSTTKIASVSRGTYEIVVDAQVNNWTGAQNSYANSNEWQANGTVSVSIKASIGAMFGWNTILFLILLLIPPAWVFRNYWQSREHSGYGYDNRPY